MSASMAPSTSRSTMKSLKRLATMAKRAPLGATRLPSTTVTGGAGRVLMTTGGSCEHGDGRAKSAISCLLHGYEGDSLHDLQSEGGQIGNLPRIIGKKLDLVKPEIGEHL